MTRGILRLHLNRLETCDIKYLYRCNSHSISAKTYHAVLKNSSRRQFSSQAQNKVAEQVQGVPYSNLKIGVPKEVWKNERR